MFALICPMDSVHPDEGIVVVPRIVHNKILGFVGLGCGICRVNSRQFFARVERLGPKLSPESQFEFEVYVFRAFL